MRWWLWLGIQFFMDVQENFPFSIEALPNMRSDNLMPFFGVLCFTHIIWVWMSYYMLNDFVQWNGNTSKARVCWHYPYDCQRQYQIPPFKRRKIPMEEVSKNHNELKIKYYIELRKRREQQIYIGAMHAIAIWWNDELKYLLYRCSGSSYYSWRAS